MKRSLVVARSLIVISALCALGGCSSQINESESAYYPGTEASEAPIELPPEASEEPSAPSVTTPAPEPAPPEELPDTQARVSVAVDSTVSGNNFYAGEFERETRLSILPSTAGFTTFHAEHQQDDEGYVMLNVDLKITEALLREQDGLWVFIGHSGGEMGDVGVMRRIAPDGSEEGGYMLSGVLCAGPNFVELDYDENAEKTEMLVETDEEGVVTVTMDIYAATGTMRATFEL